MNLLGGKIVGTGETTTLELPEGGGTITSHYPTRDDDMGMVVEVGIRPEDMEATDSENFAFPRHGRHRGGAGRGHAALFRHAERRSRDQHG